MTTGYPHGASRQARPARATLCIAALLFAFVLSGCGAGEYISPKLPYTQLATPYNAAQLGRSTSLEILNIARDPAYQFKPDQVEQALLTQSDTVIGYSGRSADARKTWLNMIVFDEFRMTARRKYFFCIDEQAERAPDGSRRLLIPSRRGIILDAEFVVDPEVLTTPYATQEAQRIAILQWLAGQFTRDLTALVGNPEAPAQGNEAVLLSGAMVNQVFQGILVEMNKSPGLAASLGSDRGVPFPHMSLGEGRIRMVAQNDAAAIKVRVNLPMTAK